MPSVSDDASVSGKPSLDRSFGGKIKGIWAKRICFFVLVLAIVTGIFVAGYSVGQRGINLGIGSKNVINTEKGKPDSVDFSLFWEAWNKLIDKSVVNPDPQKMTEGAISGVLSSLDDPYTVYLNKIENKQFKEDIQGEFFGIGIELVLKNNFPTVVAPLSDTPAEKAGIKPGDIISEVDGVSYEKMTFNELIDKIRGAEGSVVKLKIVRNGVDNPIELSITRQKITVKSVEWSTKTSAGKNFEYIKIRQFGDDTDSLFSQAAKDAIKNKPDGIIIDLRNNPGGYLDTSVDLASYFIEGGVVVSEKGRNNKSKDYDTTGSAKLKDYKVVVLINEGSASASEIMAGALRDRKESKLIGQKTFGKGSVQELIEMSDGSAVKITVAKWYTPAGTQINGEGLKPDIEVANDDNSKDDSQLNRALEYLVTGK